MHLILVENLNTYYGFLIFLKELNGNHNSKYDYYHESKHWFHYIYDLQNWQNLCILDKIFEILSMIFDILSSCLIAYRPMYLCVSKFIANISYDMFTTLHCGCWRSFLCLKIKSIFIIKFVLNIYTFIPTCVSTFGDMLKEWQ